MTDPAPPGTYDMWDEPPPIEYADQEEGGPDLDLWPDPQPVGHDQVRTAQQYSPPFPVQYLPGPLRVFVTEVSAAMQTPTALTALTALAAVAVLTGPRARIRRGPDFAEDLNLFTLVALPPGSLKSPTFRAIKRPMKAIEADQRRRFNEAREQLLAQMQQRCDDELEGEAAERYKKVMKQVADLAAARLFVQNATPEAMEQLATRNGGIVNMLDSEGAALGNIIGRYNNGKPNLEFTLIGYDCDEYVLDRVGSGHRQVERTCLTMGLTTQPEVLYELHDPKTKMGERGLLGRLVCAIPEPIDDRVTDPPEISHGAHAGWEKLLRHIVDTLPIPPVHDPLYPFGPDAGEEGPHHMPPMMGLSPEAKLLHMEYEAKMYSLRHSKTGELAYMADWVGKHYGRCLRLAGILHLAQGLSVAHPVSRATMQDAVGISDWMLECAVGVYARWHNPEGAQQAERAEAVLAWISRKGLGSFSLRDAVRGLNGRGWAKKTQDILDQLQVLAALGWLRETEALGGKTAKRGYLVSPKLWELRGVAGPAPE
jgi:replicative DNA helicase